MTVKFTARPLYIFLLILTAVVGLQVPRTVEAQGVGTYRFPTVSQNTTTTVKWTAGTLNNGGHSVTVTASSASVTTSMTDCSSPSYASCNFVYANSSGTVGVSTTKATAFAAGNTLLAYVETSTVITRIAYPQQASVPYSGGINSFTNCGSSITCATPAQVQGMAVNVQAGSAALTGGTVTITGLSPAYTQNSSTLAYNFGCTVTLNATTSTSAAQFMTCVPQSTTSIKITLGTSASSTDIIRWQTIGY